MEEKTNQIPSSEKATENGIISTKDVSPAQKLSFTENLKKKTLSFLSDKYNLVFLLILFLAFLIRLKYISQESLWNDAAVHLWLAIKVTKAPSLFFSWGYLLGDYAPIQTLTALFYLFTKNILLSGKIVAMLYALAGVIFMYLLGTELKNKFTGLIATALLTFNHLFWFYSIRPLADSPLLVTTIILLYCMIKLEHTNKILWGITSGIMFLAAMFTKAQSSLYVFALVIYYLLFKRKEMIKNKAVLVSWLIPVGSVLVAHFVAKLLFKIRGLDRIFNLFLARRGMPFGFEALGMLEWIFSWYLIPFVVLGALFVIFYKKKEYYFGIILFLFYWLFFEINVDNTQDRYMLPLLSVAVILAAFALDELGSYISLFTHKAVKYFVVIGAVLLISWNYYQVGDPLIYNKSFSYLGYEEAGTWLKENVPEKDPIFAGEYRSIRLFAEREFGGPPQDLDLGGSIWNLRSPYRYTENYDNVSQKNFEEDVKNLSRESDVYLEVDVWEYYQPKWYWPITQQSLDYFGSLGFKLVKVVERDVLVDGNPQKMPVIFIFKKDKEISKGTD
ncbi:MAG: glycosyltransferase family 39 protein [Nanoarchaeota archaeon]